MAKSVFNQVNHKQTNINHYQLVSVIMAVYIGDSVLGFKRALLSMVEQDYPNIEIIIVIDGPVLDEVRREIDNIKRDSKVPINIVSIEKNIGLGPVLNVAISKANGEYLARMDSDDFSTSDRLSTQVKFLKEHDDVDVVGCCIKDTFVTGAQYVLAMPPTHLACLAAFSWRHPINHPTALFRRRFFEKAGLYPTNMRLDEDSALWLNAFKAGCRFSNINDVKYVRFIDETFFKRRKKIKENWTVLKMRLKIISELHFGVRGYFYAVSRFFILLMPRLIISSIYYIRIRLAERL